MRCQKSPGILTYLVQCWSPGIAGDHFQLLSRQLSIYEMADVTFGSPYMTSRWKRSQLQHISRENG